MTDQAQTLVIQAACIQAAATLLANDNSLQKQLIRPGDPPEAFADAVTNLAGVLFDSWIGGNVPAVPM